MLVDTVIRAGEANPNDVVLYIQPDASLAFPKTLQMGMIWLEFPIDSGNGGGPSKFKRWDGSAWIEITGVTVY